jgi:hypothetical protein
MTVATMEETATVTLTETAASKLAGIMNIAGNANFPSARQKRKALSLQKHGNNPGNISNIITERTN